MYVSIGQHLGKERIAGGIEQLHVKASQHLFFGLPDGKWKRPLAELQRIEGLAGGDDLSLDELFALVVDLHEPAVGEDVMLRFLFLPIAEDERVEEDRETLCTVIRVNLIDQLAATDLFFLRDRVPNVVADLRLKIAKVGRAALKPIQKILDRVRLRFGLRLCGWRLVRQ